MSEVLVAIDNVWNGGHACRLCVREAIKRGTQYDGVES